jgi:hypothetical protein
MNSEFFATAASGSTAWSAGKSETEFGSFSTSAPQGTEAESARRLQLQ